MWALDKTTPGIWRFAALDLFALVYFYRKWSLPEAQHRQFHFLLMCSYLITTAFYAFQMAVAAFGLRGFAMTIWWYELMANILFECELLLIIGYAALFRRAKANRKQYYSDVDTWFEKAGGAKRGVADFVRRTFLKTGKQ